MTLTKKVRTSEDRAAVSAALDANIRDFDTAKAEADELAQRIKDLQSDILNGMDSLGVKTHTTDGVQVTRVQNTSTVVDEPRFRKMLGTTLWNKVSTRKLDKGKLDSAIKEGIISPVDLADASNEKVGTPFIRLTRKK